MRETHLILIFLSFLSVIFVPDSEMSRMTGVTPRKPEMEAFIMNEFKQKLMSAGLCAAVLLGACAPLTAMAAQTDTPAAQTAAAGAGQAGVVNEAAATRQDTQNTSPSDGTQASKPVQQEQSNERDDENDAAQQAQLAAQAQITEAEAIAAAQAVYPGSTVTVDELDGENGTVVYELKVQPADGSKAAEVTVDAVSGQVLADQAED